MSECIERRCREKAVYYCITCSAEDDIDSILCIKHAQECFKEEHILNKLEDQNSIDFHFEKINKFNLLVKPNLYLNDPEEIGNLLVNYFHSISCSNKENLIAMKNENLYPLCYLLPMILDYIRSGVKLNEWTSSIIEDIKENSDINPSTSDYLIAILSSLNLFQRSIIVEDLVGYDRSFPLFFRFRSPIDERFEYMLLSEEFLISNSGFSNSDNLIYLFNIGTSNTISSTENLNILFQTHFDSKGIFQRERIECHLNKKVSLMNDYQTFSIFNGFDCLYKDSFVFSFIQNLIHKCHLCLLHISKSDFIKENGILQIDPNLNLPLLFNQSKLLIIILYGIFLDENEISNYKNSILNNSNLSSRTLRVEFIVWEIDKIATNEKKKLKILDLRSFITMKVKNIYNLKNNKAIINNMESMFNNLKIFYKDTEFESKVTISNNSNSILNLLNDDKFKKLFKSLESLQKKKNWLDILFPLTKIQEEYDESINNPNKPRDVGVNLKFQQFPKAHPIIQYMIEIFNFQKEKLNNNYQFSSLFENIILLMNRHLAKLNKNILAKKDDLTSHTFLDSKSLFILNKYKFLRELKLRAYGYIVTQIQLKEGGKISKSNKLFDDSKLCRDIFIQVSQDSISHGEYIELLTGISFKTHRKLMNEVFNNNLIPNNNFYVIGIVGQQSSGKSTLLNRLFGTRSLESKGRCTQGIITSLINSDIGSILIEDSEGVFNRENIHGIEYDRRIGIQVMSRCQIVLINLMANIGYDLQGLLEMIFLGMQKMDFQEKPDIIFVFRDQSTSNDNEVKNFINDLKKTFEIRGIDQKLLDNVHTVSLPWNIQKEEDKFTNSYENRQSKHFFEKCIELRKMIFEILKKKNSYENLNSWTKTTFSMWKDICKTSNLFGLENFVHEEIQKELEWECNKALKESEEKLSEYKLKKCHNQNSLREFEIDIKQEKDNIFKSYNENEEIFKNRIIREKKLISIDKFSYSFELMKLNYFQNIEILVNQIIKFKETPLKVTEIQKEFNNKISQIKENMKKIVENDNFDEKQINDIFYKISSQIISELKNTFKKNEQENHTFESRLLWIKSIKVKEFELGIQKGSFQFLKDESLFSQKQELLKRLLLPIPSIQDGSDSIINNFWIKIKKLFQNDDLQINLIGSFLKNINSNIRNEHHDLSSLKDDILFKYTKEAYEYSDREKFNNKSKMELFSLTFLLILNFKEEFEKKLNKKYIDEFTIRVQIEKINIITSLKKCKTVDELAKKIIDQISNSIKSKLDIALNQSLELEITSFKINSIQPSIMARDCLHLFQTFKFNNMKSYIDNPLKYIENYVSELFELKFDEYVQKFTQDRNKKFNKKIEKIFNIIKLQLISNDINSVQSLTENIFKIEQLKKIISESDIKDIISASSNNSLENNSDIKIIIERFRNSLNSLLEKKIVINPSFIFQNLKAKLKNQCIEFAQGCKQSCPYCLQPCNQNGVHEFHQCEGHLIQGFRGWHNKYSNNASLSTCTSSEAFNNVLYLVNHDDQKGLPFATHIATVNPKWKITEKVDESNSAYMRAFVALDKYLIKKYNFNQGASLEWKKLYTKEIESSKFFGIFIGVDCVGDLKDIPAKDAKKLKDCFSKYLFNINDRLQLIQNENATKKIILDSIKKLKSEVDIDSTILIYLSGHGCKEGFCPFDFNSKQVITNNDFNASLKDFNVKQIIIIFDCCYSAGIMNINNWKYSDKVTILNACSKFDVAYQNNESSIFVKYLLQCLKGEFGCKIDKCQDCENQRNQINQRDIPHISLFDLQKYISHALSNESKYIQKLTVHSQNQDDIYLSFLEQKN